MSRTWRNSLLCLAVVALLAGVPGCSGTEADASSAFGSGENVEQAARSFEQDMEAFEAWQAPQTREVAANDRFLLEWDGDACCVLLTEKSTGTVWSTVPYDFYRDGGTDVSLSSPMRVTYVNAVTRLSDFTDGYDGVLAGGRVFARTVAQGVEVAYSFDAIEICVPVTYTLREDSLAVSVDFTRAVEGDNQILSVSLAPYLCSAVNSGEGNYLFVPAGSGALMYTAENADGERTYAGDVYGTDGARLVPEELNREEPIRLPVFGAKNGSQALLGIVERGAESARIEAEAGSSTGYSHAFVSFYARGYDVYDTQISWDYQDTIRVSDEVTEGVMTAGFYPLSGEEAGYMGMARRYRRYLLKDRKGDQAVADHPYSLYISGGAQTRSLFLGIPYRSLTALTTFSQAEAMVSELQTLTGAVAATQLIGFGKTGLDPGAVGGGFGFSGTLGGDRQRLALEQRCRKLGAPLFTDFDLVNFRSAGSGYLPLLHAAKSASRHKVEKRWVDKALRCYDDDQPAWYLLQRSKLSGAVDRLLQTAKTKSISGISLTSISSMAYSDYSSSAYAGRGGTTEQITDCIARIRESGTPVAASGANAYAAAAADVLFRTPLEDGNYDGLDVSIPFYSIVFKGYTPLYSTPVNTAQEPARALMLAVQSGVCPGFSLVGEYTTDFAYTPHEDLNRSDYAGNKDWVVWAVNATKSYYEQIAGAEITEYTREDNGLSRTVFSNGVEVYANHGKTAVESPVGTLEAYGFALAGKGTNQ